MSHRIVKAKFVRRSLCKCGFPVLRDNVPLGKIYSVYPESVQPFVYFCGGCHLLNQWAVIWAEDGVVEPGWLPLGIFELDEGLEES